MGRLMVVMAVAALAGCAQVTRFNEPGGSAVYVTDCAGMTLLESCETAMARTCPNGYQILKGPVTSSSGQRSARDARLFRCIGNPD